MTPEQLRASILQYAIQGKLVEQRPEEGTGEELYQQIQAEKQRLIQEKKIKKEKPLAEISEDEIPFDIPESWKWVRLGSVVSVYGGKRIPAGRKLTIEDTGYIYIRVSDMKDGYVSTENLQFVPQDIYPSISRYIIGKEDVFITVAGTIGRVGKIPPELDGANLTENADRLVFSQLDQDWLIKCLQSSVVQSQIIDATTKVGQPKLAIVRIQNMMIPLPPLAEQKRIVAKIEELLPLVDRYAVAYAKLEQFNTKFPESMKKSILQYAIQGKLVEQRAEEGTGEELYQQIQAEKQRLIQEKKIKKEKPLAEISEDEIPFDIPESWKWVRLGDCTGYSQTKPKIAPKDITDDMWSLDLEDIQKESGEILTRITASERKITGDKVFFYKGQVLYSKLRPYLKKILVAPDNGICTPELVPFNTYLIHANYIVYVLRSPHIDYVVNSVTYGVKMPRVGTETMVNLLIPLPPLAEQKRIVAKIEELLPLCDRLRK